MKLVYKRLSQSVILALGASFIVACGGGGSSTDTNTTADTTITHNGVEYKTVTSPTTSRVWLDRNLGAARVCESEDDVACYGDYYQWGRGADGHEDSVSPTYATQSNSISVGNNKFIMGHTDWLKNGVDDSGVLRSEKWSRTDGNSVCPKGFRVPTKSELDNEFTSNSIHKASDAFNSFLKLPTNGLRDKQNGNLIIGVNAGAIWTNTPFGNNTHTSYMYIYNLNSKGALPRARAYGVAIRCIKE